MENPADDPREFSAAGDDIDDPFAGAGDGLLCAWSICGVPINTCSLSTYHPVGLMRAMTSPQLNRTASSPVRSNSPPVRTDDDTDFIPIFTVNEGDRCTEQLQSTNRSHKYTRRRR